jgi:hypothetical protein
MATALPSTSLGSVLHELEVAAYDLATGRASQRDVAAIVGTVLELPVLGGASLLSVLRSTAPRLDESILARRQFFHAARAFVSLHRVR